MALMSCHNADFIWQRLQCLMKSTTVTTHQLPFIHTTRDLSKLLHHDIYKKKGIEKENSNRHTDTATARK